MKDKLKTTQATKLLMDYRDSLLKQSQDLKIEAEALLSQAKQECDNILAAAKAKAHQRIIRANQLHKQATNISSAIDQELATTIQQEQEVQNQWEYKHIDRLTKEWLNGKD